MSLVAVYGTLRMGQRANHLIQGVGEFKGAGVITTPCRIANLGGFPAICPNLVGEHKPKVDVYDVKDLAPLDRYEGFPHLYTREELSVELESGDTIDATVYVMNDPNDTSRAPEVPNGDWCNRG